MTRGRATAFGVIAFVIVAALAVAFVYVVWRWIVLAPPASAQSADAIRMQESLGVSVRGGMSSAVPDVDVQEPAPFVGLRNIGTVDIDVRHAPPYIRDAIEFLKAWGRRDVPHLAAVSGPNVEVRFGDAAWPLPLRDVRLTLPAGGLSVRGRDMHGDVTRVHVQTVYLRDRGVLRARSAVLHMVRAGDRYRVVAVSIL